MTPTTHGLKSGDFMVFQFRKNRVRRAYIGGSRIDRFTNSTASEQCPEEWLASSVAAFNPDYSFIENEGISTLLDGRLFSDVLEEHAREILGERLYARHEGKLAILVKLLDSAERLVIQCHPTVPFAKEHFGSNFGKTECWYFLDTAPDACVYLGFKNGITRAHWEDLFARQDVDGMLNCLHKIPVKKGDLWFVDGGIPHAIGAGCFMIELQEPSDLMVIPERATPSGRVLSEQKLHGGLGFEKMFDCFDYQGYSLSELQQKYHRSAAFADNEMTAIVDETLTDKFSMQSLRVCGSMEINLGDRYAVGVITEGACRLQCEGEEPLNLEKGNSFFIAANSGTLCFDAQAEIIVCTA